MDAPVKLCVACRWFVESPMGLIVGRCVHPVIGPAVDPVYGRPEVRMARLRCGGTAWESTERKKESL